MSHFGVSSWQRKCSLASDTFLANPEYLLKLRSSCDHGKQRDRINTETSWELYAKALSPSTGLSSLLVRESVFPNGIDILGILSHWTRLFPNQRPDVQRIH